MGTDGNQKHSKAVKNTGRNYFSTLDSTLDAFLQVAAFRRQRSAQKWAVAAAKQRYDEWPRLGLTRDEIGMTRETAFPLLVSGNGFSVLRD